MTGSELENQCNMAKYKTVMP